MNDGSVFERVEEAAAAVRARCGELPQTAIVAVMKFASVPANIARRPSRARSWRRFGASAPIPPI
jgi:hypothetical protein